MNIFIVGASRGLGLEFVRQYRADHHRVVATARDEAGLQRLRALGAEAFALDLTDAASACSIGGRIDGEAFDIVVISAGVYGPRTTGLEPPAQDDFDLVMRTNVLGPMRVVSQLADALAPHAKLALISSRMGSIGLRNSAYGWLYRASKAALNSVLKDASLELGGRATCVAFHPGWVQTDMGGAGADLTPAKSVHDLRAVLAQLAPADNGGFFDHDGSPLAW
jgi:NAD(P)-dependent dehydrogenase (short-subunit alcohol dehydrogenase family)